MDGTAILFVGCFPVVVMILLTLWTLRDHLRFPVK